MFNPALIKKLQASLLYDSPIHGIEHWMRVIKNGKDVARLNGADIKVIEYFGMLHDCMREDEWEDPLHGRRAYKFASKHRDLINLDDAQFKLLIKACAFHTHGRPHHKLAANPTIGACWDGDRLDIGRVGIEVDPAQLITDEGRWILQQRQRNNYV